MATRGVSPPAAASAGSLELEGLVIGSKMERVGGTMSRYFSEGKGRIFSEEERAKEAVYIQKMERERMEKLKKKMEKERAAAERGEIKVHRR
ncbi:uncharacterized protein A4U43_C09F640 [Asparagus officinalis]|uniref:ATPase inhibitor n=1 Tax=Asparagus officinalis TaxID=4686 RepID=A0A5P1E4G5_ASPOF|nr:uncharacterized protein A4U43_C09F640 [Asparagus officinalis]